jgi:Na+/melibiose symporter-like transporter
MKTIMSIIPAFGVALSLVVIYFYPIDTDTHKELLEHIKNKNHDTEILKEI